MVEYDFRKLLLAQSSITDIIGDRFTRMVRDEGGVLPALTYQVISSIPDPSFETDGLERMRLQLDCWGKTDKEAATLRQAVRDFVKDFRGEMGDTFVSYIEPVNQIDFYEQEPREWRLMLEVYLYYTPA